MNTLIVKLKQKLHLLFIMNAKNAVCIRAQICLCKKFNLVEFGIAYKPRSDRLNVLNNNQLNEYIAIYL